MLKEHFYKDAQNNSSGPLEGVKVLEATIEAAGPYAGMVLADLGSENIKVEMPGVGDPSRAYLPFVNGAEHLEAGTWYLCPNRNKKGITINLKAPKGQQLFRALAQKVDIIIQNFKPGTMDKWNIGYEHIKEVKPDIIYVSISGYGQYGPCHHKPSYDVVGQAMGGLMHVTGYADGPPLRVGNAIGDSITGWQAAFGALAALLYRRQTGQGQHVDVSQVDTVLYTSDIGLMAQANANFEVRRVGSGHVSGAPYNAYKCKDDYVLIGISSDSQWTRFCKCMGREDLIKDPRTNTPAQRGVNRELVDQLVADWTIEHTVAEIVEMLDKAQLVAAPILDFKEILEHEHFKEREMLSEVEHPLHGRLVSYGIPTKYSRTPSKVRNAAPLLGQHNKEIFTRWLGLKEEELERLKEEGVI